jgi:hypothetical protein
MTIWMTSIFAESPLCSTFSLHFVHPLKHGTLFSSVWLQYCQSIVIGAFWTASAIRFWNGLRQNLCKAFAHHNRSNLLLPTDPLLTLSFVCNKIACSVYISITIAQSFEMATSGFLMVRVLASPSFLPPAATPALYSNSNS